MIHPIHQTDTETIQRPDMDIRTVDEGKWLVLIHNEVKTTALQSGGFSG
jgi:hypothetical protein